MEMKPTRWKQGTGWSPRLPAELDGPRTLVLVFGHANLIEESAPVEELLRTFPQAIIVGCSTAGEIFGEEVDDDSLSVAVARFDRVNLRLYETPVTDDSANDGLQLAQAAIGADLRALLVLSDGVKVNGGALSRGLANGLPEGVVVTGGLAGDGPRFGRTWVLANGLPKTGIIAAVSFSGDALRIGWGSQGGWDIFGPERLITRSEGNILHELDGRPALALYKQYLGDRAADLPGSALLFPLALREEEGNAERVVRTILGIDQEAESMTFAGDMPQGRRVQFMKATMDRLVDGALSAATATADRADSDMPMLCVAISCVGRRLVMGERVEEEVEASMEALPAGSIQVGFYSYGELSPYTNGRCTLHNQTMTLTAFGEDLGSTDGVA